MSSQHSISQPSIFTRQFLHECGPLTHPALHESPLHQATRLDSPATQASRWIQKAPGIHRGPRNV
ncbi:hypothetical protein COCC4DRAFT_29224, partial [Bipolaris maydis ATCC 48331]